VRTGDISLLWFSVVRVSSCEGFSSQDDGTRDGSPWLGRKPDPTAVPGAVTLLSKACKLRPGGRAPAGDCRCRRCQTWTGLGWIGAEILRIRAPRQRLIDRALHENGCEAAQKNHGGWLEKNDGVTSDSAKIKKCRDAPRSCQSIARSKTAVGGGHAQAADRRGRGSIVQEGSTQAAAATGIHRVYDLRQRFVQVGQSLLIWASVRFSA